MAAVIPVWTFRRVVWLVWLLSITAACAEPSGPEVPRADPVIHLTPARTSIRVGGVVLFTAKVEGAVQGPAVVSYQWATSNPQVAVIFDVPSLPYAVGVALRPGVAEITAAGGEVTSPASVIEVVRGS